MNGTYDEWVLQCENERTLEHRIKELESENASLKRTVEMLLNKLEEAQKP